MARHLAPFSCRQTIAEIVRRRAWGGVLPLGRPASISGSRSIHAPSVSIALSSVQEGQNARHHNQFKVEQALVELFTQMPRIGYTRQQPYRFPNLALFKLQEILLLALTASPCRSAPIESQTEGSDAAVLLQPCRRETLCRR